MKYRNVYWAKSALEQDLVFPDMLAIGDSWFWYPMPGGSLINTIGDLVYTKGHVIFVAGNNGAEVYDYVKGKYRRQVREMLRLYGSAAKAVLVSGGGNDFAGFNDLRPLLNDDCAGAQSAQECFRQGGEEGTVGFLLEKMYEHYALLITRVEMAVPASTPVLVHTYDYAVPDGRGVLRGPGWLRPALLDSGVPPHLMQGCVDLLIDGARDVLHRIERAANGRVVLVDSRGTLSHSDWANELHPKPAGFRKIGHQHWKPRLQALGLA